MWQKLEESSRPELNDPVLLVALSTSMQQYRALYSQARELGKYMLKNMKFDKFATLYSSCMPPLVMISDEGLITAVVGKLLPLLGRAGRRTARRRRLAGRQPVRVL